MKFLVLLVPIFLAGCAYVQESVQTKGVESLQAIHELTRKAPEVVPIERSIVAYLKGRDPSEDIEDAFVGRLAYYHVSPEQSRLLTAVGNELAQALKWCTPSFPQCREQVFRYFE